MTLSALGLVGGEKVMLEHKTRQGKWPRRRYIEEPGFRQFRENDRVDAMDYQGRWFRGQVWSGCLLVCLASHEKFVDRVSFGHRHRVTRPVLG